MGGWLGRVQTLFETTSAALGHVRGGLLRALAVNSPARYSQLLDVPTVAEFEKWGRIIKEAKVKLA
jgi:tripartite-type tricarboxylate transporter receptor subunit TctC